AAVDSPAPNGISVDMISGEKSDSTLEMALATTFVMTYSRAATPKVDQNRPRVSCHERAIARSGRTPSSTIVDGTRNSLVPSQAYTTRAPKSSTSKTMTKNTQLTV